MAKQAAQINWTYMGDAVPAFLTIALMPFSYSIADGLIAGIMSYIIINTIVWIIEKASGGKIRPQDKDVKDPWTYKMEGGLLPPWVKRAAKGKKDFWRPAEDEEHNTHATVGNTYDGKSEGSVGVGEISGDRGSTSSNSQTREVKDKM